VELQNHFCGLHHTWVCMKSLAESATVPVGKSIRLLGANEPPVCGLIVASDP
jgi:hypothetical protein